MDFIDQLRQKSPGTKKKIAFTTSAVVTLVIFGVWVSVFHFGVDQKTSTVTATVANSSDKDVDPFSAFWSVISTGWNGLSDNINQIKTGVGNAKDLVNVLGVASSSVVGSTSVQYSSTEQPTSQLVPTQDVFILGNTTQ